MNPESGQLPLVRLFNTPTARVLDLLISNAGLPYNEAEISKLARVPSRTLQRALKVLVEEGMMKRKKRKRVFYYEANLSSARVNSLKGYFTTTMLENFEQAVRDHKAQTKTSVFVHEDHA